MDLLPINGNAARVELVDLANGLQQRGFSAAVRADQSRITAFLNGQVDALK